MMRLLSCVLFLASIACVYPQRIGEGKELQDPTQYPFFTMLEIVYEKNGGLVLAGCGGSLIHPEWVLTAGHCLPTDTQSFPSILQSDLDMIFMGSILRNQTSQRQARKIIEIHRHPDYLLVEKEGHVVKLRNDIALLRTHKPFDMSKVVQTINVSSSFKECKYGIAIGIGSTDWPSQTKPSNVVKYAKLQLVTNLTIGDPSETTIFAKSEAGKIYDYEAAGYALKGDSGGPFLCDDVAFHLQIGVISAVTSINKKIIINVIERIDFYSDFISQLVPSKKKSRRAAGGGERLTFTMFYLYWIIVFMST